MPYLIGLAAFFALFALYVSTRPSQFRITRSRTIGATPERLFALVNDFHEWAVWSPWEKLDPGMKRTYEGPSAGPSARYAWAGDKAGAGSMEITDAKPGESVAIDLRFIKPFPANNKVLFSFEPDGGGTRVTWTMDGQSNFVSKAFGVFVDMDKLVGKDFESGLEAMESASRAT